MEKLKEHPSNIVISMIAGLMTIFVGFIAFYQFFTGRTTLSPYPTAQVVTTPTSLAIVKSQTPIQSTVTKPNGTRTPGSYAVGFPIDKTRASPGETVTYEIIVTNNGDLELTNINVYEALRPIYTTYVSGSSVVHEQDYVSKDTVISDAWYMDAAGVNLGALKPGGILTFKWSVSLNKDAPVGHLIENAINMKTAEIHDPQGYSQVFIVSGTPSSNSIRVTTSFDKGTVIPGEIVTFSINIRNDGDIVQSNMLVFDVLPDTLIYKPGSTKLNFRAVLPIHDSWIGRVGVGDGAGINLGSLYPDEQATVSFQATLGNNVKNGQVVENWGQVNTNQNPNFIQSRAVFTVKIP